MKQEDTEASVQNTSQEDEAMDEGSSSGSDEDDSSSSEDESMPEIGLDQFGRLVPGPTGSVNYGCRALEGCVQTEPKVKADLLEDCTKVFTASDTKDNQAYSSGETFFIKANEKPRCALEKLALDVFKFHAKDAQYDAARSGAEFWTLVLEEDSDVAFHWDKDYNLENYCVNVFPFISTVTYLSNVGGPTMVLDKTAPPRPTDDFSGKAGHVAFCSKPMYGKHISFDGRFLHYASPDLAPLFAEKPETGTRYTFLVNIWFNHQPRDAARLGEDIVRSLSLSDNVQLWTADTAATQSPQMYPCLDLSQAKEIKYDFGAGDQDDQTTHTAVVRIPILEHPSPESSMCIEYNDDTTPFVCLKQK